MRDWSVGRTRPCYFAASFFASLLLVAGAPAGDGVAGLVVGVKTLRLEGHEEGAVLAVRILEDQASVLVHAIVAGMFLVVALVHVDVVHAIARREFEVLVLLLLGPKPGAERVDDAAGQGHRGRPRRLPWCLLDRCWRPEYHRALL